MIKVLSFNGHEYTIEKRNGWFMTFCGEEMIAHVNNESDARQTIYLDIEEKYNCNEDNMEKPRYLNDEDFKTIGSEDEAERC
jgi:hypothetical protein